MHFHKNIHLQFGCKEQAWEQVIAFYSTTYWTKTGTTTVWCTANPVWLFD